MFKRLTRDSGIDTEIGMDLSGLLGLLIRHHLRTIQDISCKTICLCPELKLIRVRKSFQHFRNENWVRFPIAFHTFFGDSVLVISGRATLATIEAFVCPHCSYESVFTYH